VVFADEKAYVDIYSQQSKPCPKSSQYKYFSSTAVGNLLSTPDRQEHARLRRHFLPALSSQALKASEGQLTEKIEWFVQHVIAPAAASGEPLEVYKQIYSLNLDIISLLSFGKSLDTLKGDNRPALFGVRSFIKVIPLTSMIPILRYLPVELIREGFRGLRELEALTRACLVAYKARVYNGEFKGGGHRSLVYNLVTAADPEAGGTTLTMDELVSNTIIFLVGGTDTTTITVCYAIWELGRRPEIRAKLRKELLDAFPDPKIGPTHETSSKLVSRLKPSRIASLAWASY
jgi:cytochrome P450